MFRLCKVIHDFHHYDVKMSKYIDLSVKAEVKVNMNLSQDEAGFIAVTTAPLLSCSPAT